MMNQLSKIANGILTRPELLILLLMVTIIGMLVIPLPTYLVDFLLGLNIVISMLVFMGSFYIQRILSFSTFPSVLLITTLFRLSLSISTSRLILLEADAGAIIASFGQFVIGDSLAVGFVVFSIVTVVQFIVITKGSERVAEVAARFSLDGMPGKQMSIDSDLRAGVIDADSARERRSVLERESQLYGSFDGAMKFIKGDAIAGIIIIFVNFIGGIAVGVSQHGMDLSTALSTYTMLTIGDGLVAQIPALLISISAGFIVTRVNGEEANLGQNIVNQLLGNQFVLLVTAVLSLGVGMLPGFPLLVFVGLACGLIGLYIVRQRAANKGGGTKEGTVLTPQRDVEVNESELELISNLDRVPAETIPLMILVSQTQYTTLEQAQLGERLRSQFFLDYGVHLPEIVLRSTETMADDRAVILINEVRAEEFVVHFEMLRVVNYSDEIVQLGMQLVMVEQGDTQCAWARQDDKAQLIKLGYQLRHGLDEFYHLFAALLARHVSEFFGVQEAKFMLDKLEAKYPDLLKEMYRHFTVQRVAEVLQRLLAERISVRNMKMIMETLAHWAPREKDVITLVEHVRGTLGRYICQKFAVRNELRALVASAEVEEVVRNGIRQNSSGAFLNLEPRETEELLDLFAVALSGIHVSHKDIVLLTSVDVRRFFKRLLETRFRALEVLSFAEIAEGISVNVLYTV